MLETTSFPQFCPDLTKDAYSLVPLRHQDIFKIKDWRNQQMDVLRQKKRLTDDGQERYYKDVVLPAFTEKEPNNLLYSYLKDGLCIGYGALVHISWEDKRAEVSFLMNSELAQNVNLYQEGFSVFLELLKMLAFKFLGLYKLYAETFDIRPLHVQVLELSGFQYEGRLKDHYYIQGNFVDTVFHSCFSNEK